MEHVLENDFLRLVVSKDGLLTEFVNKASGHNYIAVPGRDVWKLLFIDAECIENEVFSTQQRGKVEQEGSVLKVSYPRLITDSRILDINLDFSVRIADDDETIWEISLENNEQGVEISEIWFPMISGVRALGEDPRRDSLIFPRFAGLKIDSPLSKFGSRKGSQGLNSEARFVRDLYPGFASMQWYEICNEEEGLYIASYDASLQTTCLNVMKNYEADESQDNLMLSFVKYPFVVKGERWSSPPFVVSAHVGDWHVGAKKYRAWASTWMERPDPPQWVRQMVGWQMTMMKHQNGRIAYSYADIPRLYRAAQKGGLDTLLLLAWFEAGHDMMEPDYGFDPKRGGEEGLRKAIAEVQTEGANVVLFTSGVQMTVQSEWYKKGGWKASAKDLRGEEYRDLWTYYDGGTLMCMSGRHALIEACPSVPEWQERLEEVTRDQLMRVRPRGYYYDQICYYCYLCFDGSHPHEKPALAFGPGRRELSKRLRSLVKSFDPEAAVVCELLTDALLQYYDFTLPAGPGTGYGPTEFGFTGHGEWVPNFGGVHFGELFRYTFPHYICLNRFIDNDDYELANHAFVMGFRFDVEINTQLGTLDEARPEFAAYLKKLSDIRRKYAHLLLEGTFVDNEGFQIDNPRLFAKAHVQGSELGVAVWNPTQERETFTLAAPGRQLQKVVSLGEERPSDTFPQALNGNEVRLYLFSMVIVAE